MGFRTVVIKNRCKLEYSLNQMICRKEQETLKMTLDEIKTIIIDSTQVSITTALISEIIKNKIKLIFVDDKHNPSGEVVPYQNNFYSYRHIKEQIDFDINLKAHLWMEVIKQKLMNQMNILKLMDKEEAANKIYSYIKEVKPDDISNREGHGAKVYFNAIFGTKFSRDDNSEINKYLNYGYSIILSSFNREIKALGYLTELGIHHIGESNPFNLSCDFMEPVRQIIDKKVVKKEVDESNYKEVFINILTTEVKYANKNILLENAIHLFCEDLFLFLKTGDVDKIRFIEYEI